VKAQASVPQLGKPIITAIDEVNVPPTTAVASEVSAE